jgi:hypothetical protein
MTDATYFSWKAKYSGLTVSELIRFKASEEENRKVMQIEADHLWISDEIAEQRTRFGRPRQQIMLKREGIIIYAKTIG